MSIEGGPKDPNPRPNQNILPNGMPEAGYTLPEIMPPAEQTAELSRLGRLRKFGSDLLKIVMPSSKDDIIRGMGSQF